MTADGRTEQARALLAGTDHIVVNRATGVPVTRPDVSSPLCELDQRVAELKDFAEELIEFAMSTEHDSTGERLIRIAARLRTLHRLLLNVAEQPGGDS